MLALRNHGATHTPCNREFQNSEASSMPCQGFWSIKRPPSVVVGRVRGLGDHVAVVKSMMEDGIGPDAKSPPGAELWPWP